MTKREQPVSGNLTLVEEFVNSVEYPDGEDLLGTRESAAAWLLEHGFAVSSVTEASRSRLIELREGLRDLLEAHGGGTVPPGTAEKLMHQLNAAALTAVISADGAQLATGGAGVDSFVGAIAAAMVTATTEGTWRRLKICRNDECRWAFVDSSKNSSRAWCSMRSCGCQSKARAYRARKQHVTTTVS